MNDQELDITSLLKAWRDGNEKARDRLIDKVYQELRHIASGYLRRERPNHILQTTALVNEAYLKLAKIRSVEWQDRAHFFAIAAKIMRQILIDHARTSRLVTIQVPVENAADKIDEKNCWDILLIDEALITLHKLFPRQSQVLELYLFGGLSMEEIGEVLQINERTVKRDWRAARAWLICELQN